MKPMAIYRSPTKAKLAEAIGKDVSTFPGMTKADWNEGNLDRFASLTGETLPEEVVAAKIEEKKRITFNLPLFALPQARQGDMLITSWYGGINVRELPPTVSEMLGMKLNLAELSLGA